jgi:hypothetical protein
MYNRREVIAPNALMVVTSSGKTYKTMNETIVKSEVIEALRNAMPSDNKVAEFDATLSLLKDLYGLHTGDENRVNYALNLMMEVSADLKSIKQIVGKL